MLSDILTKILKESLNQTGLLEDIEKYQVNILGQPPIIDKEGNLKELPKLPDIEKLDIIIRIQSNLHDK